MDILTIGVANRKGQGNTMSHIPVFYVKIGNGISVLFTQFDIDL